MRRLQRGLGRVFEDHRSALAVAYRREYGALLEGLGVNGDVLLRRECARVALLAIRARVAGRAWAQAVEKRASGRGRRPSRTHVEQLARRAALDDTTYESALSKLRVLAAQANAKAQPVDVARAIQQAQEAAR